jgi:secretion/DNA translocation related CpaE-like protein
MPSATALLVTRDDALLEDLLRLAAAAGVTMEVAHDVDSSLRSWASAPVVLVGADLLAELAGRQPVRRSGVHVLAGGDVPDRVFRAALEIGAVDVAELPAAETWLVELLTDAADGQTRRAVTVGVVGGSGGIGATTFAAALAMTAARSGKCLLIDSDPLGGGVDRVVGMEDLEGVRWDALGQATGRFSSRSLREALPHRDRLAVLTWAGGPHQPAEGHAVREVLSAARRGNDSVVVDLPRHRDPVIDDVISRCDHVVLLVGLTVPAVAAAGRVAAHLHDLARPLHLVTRGRITGLAPEEVSRALDVPLAATMVDQRRLAEAIDLGLGPVRSPRGPIARAARTVLSRLTVAAEAGG